MHSAGWVRAVGILVILAGIPARMGVQLGARDDHWALVPGNATDISAVYLVADDPGVLGVLHTAMEHGGYSVAVTRSLPRENWDLAWTFDPSDTPEDLAPHQRVNHFPGTRPIAGDSCNTRDTDAGSSHKCLGCSCWECSDIFSDIMAPTPHRQAWSG